MCRLIELFTFVVLLHVTRAVKWDTFATKTSYFWSRDASAVSGNLRSIVTDQNNTCEAINVNLVVRHGARNPTAHNIKDIGALHSKLVIHKSPDRFPFLDQWTSRYDIATESELVPAGAEEAEFLGTRFGESFRALFGTQRHPEVKYEFVTSSKKRTVDSARNFYRGFAKKTGLTRPFTSHVNNSLTRFYDGCTRYETMVVDNMTNFLQFETFASTTEFQDVGFDVKQRLGMNETLTQSELYLLHTMCAYETYIFNDTAWCDLMTDAEREVMEYGQDIQNYYESMYGNPLNTEVACPLVRELFYGMDAAVKALNASGLGNPSTSYMAGRFFFAHSETVAKMLAALGLFRDTPGLFASNMAAMTNRKFRASHVLPYAANVAFVLYKCGPNSGQPDGFKVKIIVNEEEMVLPACGNQVMCDYETLRQAYSMLVEHCDEKRFCELHSVPIVG